MCSGYLFHVNFFQTHNNSSIHYTIKFLKAINIMHMHVGEIMSPSSHLGSIHTYVGTTLHVSLQA